MKYTKSKSYLFMDMVMGGLYMVGTIFTLLAYALSYLMPKISEEEILKLAAVVAIVVGLFVVLGYLKDLKVRVRK